MSLASMGTVEQWRHGWQALRWCASYDLPCLKLLAAAPWTLPGAIEPACWVMGAIFACKALSLLRAYLRGAPGAKVSGSAAHMLLACLIWAMPAFCDMALHAVWGGGQSQFADGVQGGIARPSSPFERLAGMGHDGKA